MTSGAASNHRPLPFERHHHHHNQQQTSPPSRPQMSAPVPAASPPSRRDLKSWWKGFKLAPKNQENADLIARTEGRPRGIFGVPLRQSITYANVAISLIDDDGKSYIYGYVPIVVAKCGVFLKEKATGIEGIFRLSGSEKRIKELKTLFDSPDKYGKGLDWTGYTVHDAANVLRRYLNDLPEPVVPIDLYEKFRAPLKGATTQPPGEGEGPQFVDNFDMKGAIEKYQQLITELPPLNRQLLLYILDLLAVFAAKADENRMNPQNLAAIFQPGMLSHPGHAMAPEEYRLNQCVIIFLIENQDHFLIGMQGTAADEKTVREVQKGTPVINAPDTSLASRASGVARSASNASAGAESVAKEGKIRRNKSTSSRHSRQSTNNNNNNNNNSSSNNNSSNSNNNNSSNSNNAPSPGSPSFTGPSTGGLTRSNTVPSKKSPNLPSARFQKHESSSTSVAPLTPLTPPATYSAPPPQLVEEAATPSNSSPITTSPTAGAVTHGGASDHKPEAATPSKERNLQALFQRSPAGDGERRQPNKLRKKRLPGSTNPSAQSSTASLPHSTAVSPTTETSNPLDSIPSSTTPQTEGGPAADKPPAAESSSTSSTTRAPQSPPSHSNSGHNSTLHPDSADYALRTKMSPPTSLHSSFNDGSDLDQADEAGNADHDRERRKRWHLSRKKDEAGHTHGLSLHSPRKDIGQNTNAESSVTSVGSSSHKPRRSITGDSSDPTLPPSSDTHFSLDSANKDGKDESKSLTGWIKNKYREAKETAEQRRNKSPPADRSSAHITTAPTTPAITTTAAQASTVPASTAPASAAPTSTAPTFAAPTSAALASAAPASAAPASAAPASTASAPAPNAPAATSDATVVSSAAAPTTTSVSPSSEVKAATEGTASAPIQEEKKEVEHQESKI